jgi:hypothetical protein
MDSARLPAESARASPTDTMMYASDGKNPPWLTAMFDTTLHWESGRMDSMPNKVVCHTFARYRVVTRDKDKETGSDVIVRNAGSLCAMDSLSGDFVLRNKFAEYFAAIRGNLLLINSGTGPQDSYALYDIPTRRELGWISGEILGWQDSTTVLIWERKGNGTHAMCPKVREGLSVVIDSLYSWDVKTGKRSSLGRIRCDAES